MARLVVFCMQSRLIGRLASQSSMCSDGGYDGRGSREKRRSHKANEEGRNGVIHCQERGLSSAGRNVHA